MVRYKGLRKKSREKLRKSPRERGMPPVTRSLQSFQVGEKVRIVIDPSIVKGMPHPRYHGYEGTVIEKRGRAYVVLINNKGREKKLISRPEHLRAVR